MSTGYYMEVLNHKVVYLKLIYCLVTNWNLKSMTVKK